VIGADVPVDIEDAGSLFVGDEVMTGQGVDQLSRLAGGSQLFGAPAEGADLGCSVETQQTTEIDRCG
jgi:hypothetical protein